jgi:murein DD-endopeptidase MepM/ murein hydrolase activator NlpD
MQRGVSTYLLLIVVVGGFAALLWRNSAPTAAILAVLPTESIPTENPETVAQLLREGFGHNSTPLPTVAIPDSPLPTLIPPESITTTPISVAELAGNTTPVLVSLPVYTPTPPLPTLVPGTPGAEVTVQSLTVEPQKWNPPALIPPISLDPLGRDHYWFMRPVDSSGNNGVLSYYSFGSDGPDKTNPLRVHHGIDMPNPVGVPVRAAGDGTVTWAADGRQETTAIFQNSPSYGNVIVIQHDFSYNGIPLYTLYAHLSASFVQPGQRVSAGQVIGQVGNTGRVSGPHVHFEVRFGIDPGVDDDHRYGSAYNPALWMVPYVGMGVIAGRVVDRDGLPVMDADITIRNRARGTNERTTTSYIYLDNGYDVNADPQWQENFAVPDIPAGRYDVIADIYGERVIAQVTVVEGMTTFVEVKPSTVVTPVTTPTPGGG